MKPIVVATALFTGSVALLGAAGAGAQKLKLGKQIALPCANPGSHQDVAKTPTITNDSVATIPKGKVIEWTASDGDSGKLTLEKDLPKRGTVQVSGQAGQSYTCTAKFDAGVADLVAKAPAFTATGLTLQIANSNAFVGAAGAAVRVEYRSCASHTAIVAKDVGPIDVAGGSTVGLPVVITKPAGSYVWVKVDSTQKVLESNEQNNVHDDVDACVK